MPLTRSRLLQTFERMAKAKPAAIAALMVGMISAPALPALAAPDERVPVRSRQVELHYRLNGTSPAERVELWYTRGRGTTWQYYGVDDNQTSPLVFCAPAEGLYGFKLVVRDAQKDSRQPPNVNEKPQRWVFIDYTPPLVQWGQVAPGTDFATRRIVHLQWTAYDNNLLARGVSLAYQSSIDQTWQTIDAALRNTGRYDWTVPANLTGQITLKLTVRDQGGHVVERLHNLGSLDRWLKLSSAPATADLDKRINKKLQKTSVSATTKPATDNYPQPISVANQKKAQELYGRGSLHLVRGEYALAAERFREALELNPDLLAAMNDLAGIYYTQRNYPKAIDLYSQVLVRNNQYESALLGSALVHSTQKQYPQSRDMLNRLLAINEKNPQALLYLGDVSHYMGDYDIARGRWSQAASVDASAKNIIREARRRLATFNTTKSTKNAKAKRGRK